MEMGGKTLSPASQESMGLGEQGPVSLAEAQKIREKLCRTDWKDRLGHQGEEADPTGTSGHWHEWSLCHPPTPRHLCWYWFGPESQDEGTPRSAGASCSLWPVSVFPLLVLLTSVGFQSGCKFCGPL